MLPAFARLVLLAFAALAGASVAAGPALAHPHVWVLARAELVYAPDGKLASVRHHWMFDEAYSAVAVQGLDTNGDGRTTPDEMADLAKANLESLAEWSYFTSLKAGGAKQAFQPPRNERMTFEDGRVTLHFELPLKNPAPGKLLVFEVYDATFFVDFQPAPGAGAITLAGAPAGCSLRIARPKQEAPPPGKALPGAESDYNAFSGMGADFASRTMAICP